jgi:predicted dehydrogenase
MNANNDEPPVLRVGILGAAFVARLALDGGIQSSSKIHISAVASRDRERANAFAAEYNIPRAVSYGDLLDDTEIDAIYIALPNALHAEWAIRAAGKGKHVICEKPLTISAEAARAMFAAAQANNVRLLEAYPYLAQPQIIAMRRMIKEGAIGDIRTITASFGFTLPGEDDIRFDPTLGGGALLDAGSYPLSLIRVLAGSAPSRVHAIASRDKTGIDRTVIANLYHKNGVLAQLSCSFDAGLHRHALITGDNGVIETKYPNHTSNQQPAAFTVTQGNSFAPKIEELSFVQTNGFFAEFESFADTIARGSEYWTGVETDESIDIAKTLEAIALSFQTNKVVDVEP